MRNRGFTLIELMIVVVIIGIIAAIVGGFMRGGLYSTDTAVKESKALAQDVIGLKDVKSQCLTAQGDTWGQKLCTVAGKDSKDNTVVTSMDCRSSGCVVRK